MNTCPKCDREDHKLHSRLKRKVWFYGDKGVEQIEYTAEKYKCNNCGKIFEANKPDNMVRGVSDTVVELAEQLLLSYSVNEVKKKLNGAIGDRTLNDIKKNWEDKHKTNDPEYYDNIESMRKIGIYKLRTIDAYFYCLCNFEKETLVDIYKPNEIEKLLTVLKKQRQIEVIYVDDTLTYYLLSSLEAYFSVENPDFRYNYYSLVNSVNALLFEEIQKLDISEKLKYSYFEKMWNYYRTIWNTPRPAGNLSDLTLLRLQAIQAAENSKSFNDIVESEQFQELCPIEAMNQKFLDVPVFRSHSFVFPSKYSALITEINRHVAAHPNLDYCLLRNRLILATKPITVEHKVGRTVCYCVGVKGTELRRTYYSLEKVNKLFLDV